MVTRPWSSGIAVKVVPPPPRLLLMALDYGLQIHAHHEISRSRTIAKPRRQLRTIDRGEAPPPRSAPKTSGRRHATIL